MPVYNNVWPKPPEEPEERHVEELQRSNKKWGKTARAKSTSVTLKQVTATRTIVSVLVGLALFAVLAFLIYKGVTLFTSPQ